MTQRHSSRVDVLGPFKSRKTVDGLPGLLLRQPDLAQALQIEPELGARPEEMRKPQRRIPCDGPVFAGISPHTHKPMYEMPAVGRLSFAIGRLQ